MASNLLVKYIHEKYNRNCCILRILILQQLHPPHDLVQDPPPSRLEAPTLEGGIDVVCTIVVICPLEFFPFAEINVAVLTRRL
jgi:hypothetical protein